MIGSESTVARRLKKLGLFASGLTTKLMPEAQKRQYILDQLSKHSGSKKGPRTVKKDIAKDAGVFLTRWYQYSGMYNSTNQVVYRDYIISEMRKPDFGLPQPERQGS